MEVLKQVTIVLVGIAGFFTIFSAWALSVNYFDRAFPDVWYKPLVLGVLVIVGWIVIYFLPPAFPPKTCQCCEDKEADEGL